MLEFSIIIPVFNAENTLGHCLDSIREQTFTDFEVILIDDGSVDNSLNICQHYCALDERFVVLHQENGGPSKARNIGLEVARGKRICFIDSDDSVVQDYLQYIYDVAMKQNADAVFIGYHKLDIRGNERGIYLPSTTANEKMELVVYLSDKDMFGYTWIKSFSREAIGNIRFEQDLNLFEDEIFACQVLERCENIGIVQYPIYNYTTGMEGALTGKTYEDYCSKCDRVYAAWKQLFKAYPEKQRVLKRKANAFVGRCYYYGMERDVNLMTFFEDLAKTSFFVEHTSSKQFDKYVQSGNYRRLYLEKLKYNLKVQISNLIRGR